MTVRLVAIFALLSLTACNKDNRASVATLVPGEIQLNQRVTDVPQGGAGTGTLFLNGKLYQFTIGGLGLDGSAVSVIKTTGEAYRVDDIARFPGVYRQAPSDASRASGGLWLQNRDGVLLHLLAPPHGDMPSIGDDAVLIRLQ